MSNPTITPAHCRAARGLLDWSLKHLATRSDVGVTGLRDFERDRPSLSPAALAAVQQTFENAGIEFLIPDGTSSKAVGVCFLPND